MKKQLIIFLLIISALNTLLHSQAPAIAWQQTLGGNQDEYLLNDQMLRITSDGGMIVGSASNSPISGNKTEGALSTDYWIIKLNAAGIIEWQQTVGGAVIDNLNSVQETNDGGYIVGGSSSSGISGDKTEDGFGGSDIWVIKLDALGNVEWQKTIGGSGNDGSTDIQPTVDGDYVIVGSSNSPISGNKTVANFGGDDIWILKLDATGNIIWQSTIGGSVTEYATSLLMTADGGFIIGGNSDSPASGNKTESNIGLIDLWIVKMNAVGSIEWQNTIGGASTDNVGEIVQLPDGNYYVAAYSNSAISGDKTESSVGNFDYWILKLNITGNIIWQNTIGGNKEDRCYGLDYTADGGLIVGGYSFSGISGDKTEAGFGGFVKVDYWLVKTNSSGVVEWDKCFGGNGADFLFSVNQLDDDSYVLAGYSNSGITGNKTQASYGFNDIWLLRLSDDFCIPSPEICNAVDDNCNGIIDDFLETIDITTGGATTFCQGGTVLLSATYSGASIQWKKNGVTIPGANSATYSVNKTGNYSAVTNSPCGSASSTTINVFVNKNPNASISAAGPTTFCDGGSVLLTEIAVAGCTYQWYKGANPIAGATSLTYSATTSGNYKCRVTKTTTGCYKNSNAIAVSVTCKEADLKKSDILIYPNPSSGNLELSSNNPLGYVEIYNSLGQNVYRHHTQQTLLSLNLSPIPSGLYIIKIFNGNQIFEQRWIIED